MQLKHYFNISDIVFIFAVDLEQLAYSIATMYGSGMDSSGYLRRFFDFNINIPTGDIKQYVDCILRDNFDKMVFPENFIDTVVNIYNKLGLSLRDIDKITNNFLVFCLFYKHIFDERIRLQRAEIRDVLEVYLYFMTLKYKYPNISNMIIKQEFIAYDNRPQNWNVLELKYFVSPNISKLLKEIQTGGAKNINNNLIMKYGMVEVNSDGVSFAEHIERTIEMFS